jgi:hypothetical protein
VDKDFQVPQRFGLFKQPIFSFVLELLKGRAESYEPFLGGDLVQKSRYERELAPAHVVDL